MNTSPNILCPNCGAQIEANARFCKECGHAVETSSETSQPPPPPPTPQIYTTQPPAGPRSNWPQIALIVGGIVLCCGVLVFLGGLVLTRFSGSSTSPQATALRQSTPIPVNTGQPAATTTIPMGTPQANIPACPGVDNLPQLKIGDQAVVVNVGGYSLFVYDAPSHKANFLAAVPEGALVKIISGPVCAENSCWWKVEYGEGGQGGWMVEAETNEVFLKPKQ